MPNQNTFKYFESGELVNEYFPTQGLDFIYWEGGTLQSLAINIGVDFSLPTVFDLFSTTESVAVEVYIPKPMFAEEVQRNIRLVPIA